ncbi:HET-domain-containing protein [Stipitochalara longipes BDJ]|nr:HET-domain-containing protein [Stipitochalara longipes BDJ]
MSNRPLRGPNSYDMTGKGPGDEAQTKASSAPYPYQPLDFDTHEIRVLSLTITEIEDELICCTMETMSLIDPKPYYALSYCWGDRHFTDKILLDLGIAIVTESLWLALKAVRRYMASLDRSPTRIRLWVDAMCINQNNNQERSQQVRNMRQIYSRAEEVFAWVGHGELLSADLPIILSELILEVSNRNWTSLSKMLENGDSEVSKAANVFFGEKYWRRVWIIQEITVASKVTILYNDCEFRWEDVAAVLFQLQTYPLNPATAEAIKGAVHLLKFRDGYTGQNLIYLFDALAWSRRALATDPRDKIFALLGLCHDGPTFVPVPNYKQDLSSIIADMSKMMMTLEKSLDSICLRGVGERENCTLPSWATDWPMIWSGMLTIQEEDILKHGFTPHSRDPILPGSSHKVLKVRGTELAVVTKLATAFGTRDMSSSKNSNPSGWLLSTSTLRVQKPALESNSSKCETRDTIWDTLTMSFLRVQDRVRAHTDSPSPELHINPIDAFESIWRPEGRGAVEDHDLIKWIDDNAWFTVGPWTLREWSQVVDWRQLIDSNIPVKERSTFKLFSSPKSASGRSPQKESSEKDSQRNLTDLISTLHKVLSSGMRLACIDSDHHCPVAMVHPDVKIGDRLFYLEGCSMPVVLRSADGLYSPYRVVGACHLGTRISDRFVMTKASSPGGWSNPWSIQFHPEEIVLV